MYLARSIGMEGAYAGPLLEAEADVRAYFSTVLVRPREVRK